MNMFTKKVLRFISSELFFRLIIGLLVLEAAWIAIGARYPQAFDEQFHFGLIQLHAQHWWPLLSSQPTGTESLGAFTRDPSFLYHYLFSFPYRLLSHITSNLTTQIIVLRLMNVALFASALVPIRKVLRYSSASPAMIHTSLFFFVLIPVVPMLAATINYDNLFIILVSLTILCLLRFRAAKTFNTRLACQLLLLGTFTSLVKYAYLPIFVAVVGYLIYRVAKSRPEVILKDARALPRSFLLVGGVLLVLGGGLFVERYGLNMLQYHSPIPECDQVLSIDRCQSYGPWARNYMLANMNIQLSKHQTYFYPYQWLCRMMQELTFAISSGFNGYGSVDYWQAEAPPVSKALAWVVLCTGTLAIVLSWKKLRQEPVLRIVMLVGGAYILALFAQNYLDYLHTSFVVAVHGRYLLPFAPMLLLAIMLAFRQLLQRKPLASWNRPAIKVATACAVALLFVTQGGGDVTYITRSESRWFWPQNHLIQRVNADAQSWLKSIVIGV